MDVDSASDEMIEIIAAALETRATDPSMVPVIDAYLDALSVPEGGLIVDIGCGTGGITRRIANHFPQATVVGLDPSAALTRKAGELAAQLAGELAAQLARGRPNLSFSVGDGAKLSLKDGCADVSILHTVLSHVPDPAQLIAEASRILRPGGTLVICDADFSKAAMSNVPGDPLGSCAEAFVSGSVTDSWLIGKLRPLVDKTGLTVIHFSVLNRVVTSGMGGMVWVRMSCARLVADGVIGQPLAQALEAEYLRRAEAGTLYCFLPFATLIATKPIA
jgi:ubiquinone/menaquinone biosynthesis C-methylase UbiE